MSPVLALILGLALCVVDNLARRRLSVAEVAGVVLAVYAGAKLLAALLG
jgi:hypothetical protein